MSQPPAGIPGARQQPPLLRQRWQTINPAHAIQRAAVVLTFPEEIPSFVVMRVVEALRPFALGAGLLKEEALNSMLIQIGPGGAQNTTPTSQTGSAFQDVRNGQVAQALKITKEAIRFEIAEYTRWVALRDQLEKIFSLSFPILEQSTTVQSIGLEYVDFFFAVAEGEEDAGLIIDNQSQLIARRAFRKREPFHSHSGWFERETAQSRFLVNVDLSVADALGPIGQRRAITVRTFEAEQIIDSLSDRAKEMVQVDKVLTGLDAIHASLKERLSNLLTREARTMISLGT